MSISVVLGFKSKNISGFVKQNPLKQQNQLYFGANISKIVTESADEVMVGIKKLAPDSIDEITQGVKKKLTLDSIQDVFQGAKKKPAINMGEDEVLSIRQKIKKVAQKIKESISDVFKKRSKDVELPTNEQPLVVFNKGPRNVNVMQGQDKAIKEINADFEAGKISEYEKNNRIREVNNYFENAKKSPKEVSSKKIIQEQPKFRSASQQVLSPPPGHSAGLSQASQPAQQSMQSHMNGMTQQEFIIYKEFIEKKKRFGR